MPKPSKRPRKPVAVAKDEPAQALMRRPNGTFQKGYSGSITTDAARARRTLNTATIAGMQWAFDKHGRAAIEKVARTQPAIFLKMLVLLVPRELEVTTSSGARGMSDEQLDNAIELIKAALAKRAPGDGAKDISPKTTVIEADPS